MNRFSELVQNSVCFWAFVCRFQVVSASVATVASHILTPFTISAQFQVPTYIEPVRAVVRTRLAQAGARLARLLNETLR